MLKSTIEEIKKPLNGFETLYEISSHGYVSNYRKKLKVYYINSGYACLKLFKDGKKFSFLVHRLVAENFIPNSNIENREVNHIDGNKLNNSVNNLEWVSRKENVRHSINAGLTKYNKPSLGIKIGKSSKYNNVFKVKNRWGATVRVNKKNMFLKIFDTEREAALHVNKIIDTLNLQDRKKNIVD